MHTLEWTFKILNICGFFPPISWTSPRKRFFYNAYTATVSLFVYSCTITQVLDLVYNVKTQEDLTENFCMLPTLLVSSCKLSSMITNRGTIRNLVDALQKGLFRPINDEEMKIRTKFERSIRRISVAYAIPVELCVAAMCISSVFTHVKIKELMLRAWLPYDFRSSNLLFTFTYVHQFLALLVVSAVVITYDNLFNGLIIHISCQLAILEHRLKNIKGNGNYSLKQCARHHDYIYKYATRVNGAFRAIMPVQFSVTTTMICFVLYRLTQMKVDAQFMSFTILMCCTFTQIFYYCWSGNETKLKSLEISDVIFESNWMSLNKNGKRILLIIMKRAMVPIEFTSASVLSMNLESFKGLVKTGYSAYNVLIQTNT